MKCSIGTLKGFIPPIQKSEEGETVVLMKIMEAIVGAIPGQIIGGVQFLLLRNTILCVIEHSGIESVCLPLEAQISPHSLEGL